MATKKKLGAASAVPKFKSSTRASVPVIDEMLQVDKTLVDLGGVRLSKKVHRREVVVDEELQSEQVEVERRTIGTRIESVDLPKPRYEGDTYIIPVIQEIVVTEKRLMLVEEVRITVVRSTRRDPQCITLQREEVVVEQLDPEPRNP